MEFDAWLPFSLVEAEVRRHADLYGLSLLKRFSVEYGAANRLPPFNGGCGLLSVVPYTGKTVGRIFRVFILRELSWLLNLESPIPRRSQLNMYKGSPNPIPSLTGILPGSAPRIRSQNDPCEASF